MSEELNLRRLDKRFYRKSQIKKWQRQRVTRGFSDFDTWNLDAFLIELLPNAIEYLAKHLHGYPGHEPWETPEKYNDYLMNLVVKFREVKRLEYSEDFCSQEQHARAKELIKEAMSELGEVFFTLWD